MTEEELLVEAKAMSPWQQHKFMVLVGITIVTALMLVAVSLHLYKTSGAAQLDLSRPGYESVRKQASHTSEFSGYPSTGAIDKDALTLFRSLYGDKLKEAMTGDSFGGEVMSDASLGIAAPTGE